MAPENRIFISFAAEDKTYRDYLVEQAKEKKSSYTFVDISVKKPWDKAWKINCREKIKGCDGMIALVSANAEKARGQLWEVKCAKEESVPVCGIHVNANNKPAALPTEFSGIRVVNWTWDNISDFLTSLIL
jgi:hypothetical protein